MADAILNRLVHNAYKINLKGGSMRKRQSRIDFHYRPRVTIHKPRVATDMSTGDHYNGIVNCSTASELAYM